MTSDRRSSKTPLAISYLFVPGNRPERFSKAVEANPDAIILDLEDAVHPDSKPAARAAIWAWQESTPSVSCERYIRLNSVGSTLFHQDQAWLNDMRYPERCNGIFLPKVECPDALGRVVEQLLKWQPELKIIAIIETAKGLQQVESIAAIPGVARLAFGSLDFSLDINCSQIPEAFLFARHRIVLASRTADLPSPIDGVTPAISDLAVVGKDALYARSLGFGAKLCIHPSQLVTVQRAFLPDSRQLAWADRVMRAVATGSHAVQVDGEMVDLPLIEHARRLLDVASQYAPIARAGAC
ncbi:HpcH/HpaI aldolase/citrate lyase family protein [Pseudomonas moorei]|uniref:Citrate lyase subunit beta / citryl-CoA lyase n=1 Tax=Pseudomonas moorei TaxID=395599 RepID=A0A1H1FX41_9PSED|nr:CoA ester lyase [Pseudomonas moorei]KAB0509463.1 CoA ester lyase [Pseudomonas moorei]SDR05563.1 citrate lyase subunit beta / citryl-CoA lyase [Pseudomonas moorei]